MDSRVEQSYLDEIKTFDRVGVWNILEHIPEQYKTKKVCLAAVSKNGFNLRWVPAELKTERMCLRAVETHWQAWDFVPFYSFALLIRSLFDLNHHNSRDLKDPIVKWLNRFKSSIKIDELDKWHIDLLRDNGIPLYPDPVFKKFANKEKEMFKFSRTAQTIEPIKAPVNRDSKGLPTNKIIPTESKDQAQDIINQANGGGASPDAYTAPKIEVSKNTETNPSSRTEQVKSAVKDLSDEVNQVAISIYQMKLTVPQLQELTTKLINTISDTISEITIQRVKDIAPEILGTEE